MPYEKRVARNRFILLVIVLFLILFGVISVFVKTIERAKLAIHEKPNSSNCRFPPKTANSPPAILKKVSQNWTFQGGGERPREPSTRAKIPTEILKWHHATTAALKTVLSGRDAKKLPPLDWSSKTDFQKSVLA